MRIDFRSKLVKFNDYDKLVEVMTSERAERVENKFALVCNNKVYIFNKDATILDSFSCGDVINSRIFDLEISVALADSGKAFFVDFTGKVSFLDNTDEWSVCPICGKLKKGALHRCRTFAKCSRCGEEIEKGILKKYGVQTLCPTCWALKKGVYSSYHTKPSLDFLNRDKEINLGIELEVDAGDTNGNRESAIQEASAILNKIEPYHKIAVFCSDSSLDYGFEIKTSPRPLSWYVKHKEEFAKAFGVIDRHEFRGHDINTAGLHISLDLHKFGTLAAMKYSYIWNKNITFFDILARRTSKRSGSYYNYKDYNTSNDVEKIKEFAYTSHSDVINAEHTSINRLENRHFKSTLSASSFIAALDIARAVLVAVAKYSLDEVLADKVTMQEVVNNLQTSDGKAYVRQRLNRIESATGLALEVK